MSDGIENPLNVTSEPDQPQPEGEELPTVAHNGAPTTRQLIAESKEKSQPQDYLSGGAQNLLAAIVSQNARDAAFTSNALIESYRSERDTLAATLSAVRNEFSAAMAGPYMPSPGRLLEILYPSEVTIDEYREG